MCTQGRVAIAVGGEVNVVLEGASPRRIPVRLFEATSCHHLVMAAKVALHDIGSE
jgi:hypothetical protein